MKSAIAFFAGAALVAGCRVGRDYVEPNIEVPPAWSEASAAAAPEPVSEVEIEWWKSFRDPTLDTLVARAVALNLDLALARARVCEARAARDAIAGAREPAGDARAGYARTRSSENTPQGAFVPRYDDNFQLGFDARWELDLFGRVARNVEAADAGVESAEADGQATLVSLLGEVARNYVELCGLQRQIALTRSNVAVQQDTLGLTRSRFEAGLATDLDVARAEALVATTSAEIPAFDTTLRQTLHRLGVLLGKAPAALSEELAEVRPVPVAPERVVLGIPSDLLRRRPDIRRAERELARATALSAAATAELFPRISLGASIGQQSDTFRSLLDSASNTWSFGPSLSLPIFRGGTLRANIRIEDARAEQAAIAYERTVLEALAEVEDALAAVARERERILSLEQAVASNRRAVDLSNELQLRGLADFFEVLEAQRQQFQAESELARSTTALATETVALYKALGGGWQIEEEQVARARDR